MSCRGDKVSVEINRERSLEKAHTSTKIYAEKLGSLTHAELTSVYALLSRAISERVTPGAQLWIGAGYSNDGFLAELEINEGRTSYTPDAPFVTSETHYDLASLTKPLATATWMNSLISQRMVDPQSPIKEWVQCEDQLLGESPVWRLLNHSSGLPAHFKYFKGLGGARLAGAPPERCRATVQRMIASTPTLTIPGERSIYSDLGYLLLEQIATRASGESLERFWSRAHPSGQVHFRSLVNALQNKEALTMETIAHSPVYAPTEECPWRDKLICGEVHDDNAWLLGGVCGHAGLFGSARSVGMIAGEWLKSYLGAETQLPLTPPITQWMLQHQRRAPQRGSFVLGWDTPSGGYSSAGQRFSGHTIGHLGFTGTSIWIDLTREVVVVLLTNRVHPQRERSESIKGIRWLRPQIHNAIWGLLEA